MWTVGVEMGRPELRNALKVRYGKAFGFERAMNKVGAILAMLSALSLVSLAISYLGVLRSTARVSVCYLSSGERSVAKSTSTNRRSVIRKR